MGQISNDAKRTPVTGRSFSTGIQDLQAAVLFYPVLLRSGNSCYQQNMHFDDDVQYYKGKTDAHRRSIIAHAFKID